MKSLSLTHLQALESESIHIMREVAAEFDRPVLLFSGGKDSICMLRIAEKAFRPGAFPFPLLHIDTGHNFPELIAFRDTRAAELGAKLIVRTVDDAIEKGMAHEVPGTTSRNRLQTPTLLAALEEFKFNAAMGGARRDEEKARAKERVFSFRDAFGQWEPKNQRPELWNIYNAKIHPGENMRVFPISNWTELDVWGYIAQEKLNIPKIYYSHKRRVFRSDGQWLPVSNLLSPQSESEIKELDVRVRTIGDITCTGCIESSATTVKDIIAEIAAARVTERGSRADDKVSEAAMEDRKREGYF
ncbi:MAG: sulfate adenylyltransferase subunit CysD [Kiritimatiellae bacterium]|nr:sulfate adenylyltransferase subunit CysD [Kiritimatiellia bacterium]